MRQEIPLPAGIEAPFWRDGEQQLKQDSSSSPHPANESGVVLQRVRQVVGPAPQPASLAHLNTLWADIQAQIAEIDPNEVSLGFVDMTKINTWSGHATTRIAALATLNPGAAHYTWAQAVARSDAMTTAFHAVFVSLGNLRSVLNASFTEYRDHRAQQEASEKMKEGFKLAAASKAPKAEEEEAPSPSWTVKQYYKDRAAAVVLVEGDYVVFVEHYQLKHNSDLGVLQAGGPFKGKKGSQMPGGWEAHVSTYAPQVLAFAKTAIQAANGGIPGTLAKQRNDTMEVYITVLKEGKQWLIFYHCNP